jgi:rubrerythrin
MANLLHTPTLHDLFDRAIQIEKQAELIYKELEQRFVHHPEAAALWKALAADEAIHA